ncbi:ATPase, T2SS/T4P/T4SS family, partial [Sulfoacidibacillus ferrooxidans]|uniref:ATPase, T2SS/T4P/T4SS family n=1 Tax=Sulfoacidibacillus ferrooxidans TaxID=2005001 RepID=UPI001F512756
MDTLDTLQTYQEKLYQAVLHHPVYGKSAHARSELYTFLLTQATEPATFVPVSQREAVISSLLNAWYSYDAIQSAIDDPLVTDIHVMGDRTVLRKEGRLMESTESRFANDDRLVEFVKRKLEKTPFSYSLADPVTDAMLPEGYRLNVIGGQNTGYSVVGDDHRIETATMATIRKPIMPFRMEQLIRLGMMNQELADLVKGMAIVGDSFVIAGGVGSGKTTLLNALTEYMDGYINCAIEEMGEMVPLSNWWIRLTDRMGNAQGIGAITMER